MKHVFKSLIIIALLTSFSGCKKFLNVDPPSDLSGNNFWRNKGDVERFVNGLYELFREAVYRPDMTAGAGDGEFPFFTWSGDMRGAPVLANSPSNRRYITELSNNNLNTVVNNIPSYSDLFNAKRFTQWNRFFKVIASANIAVDRIPTVPNISFSEDDAKRYVAEAIFIRNMAYFFMVRLWGDIPYYTQPYFDGRLARMNQVEVLQKCLADLEPVYKDLPWTYSDPTQIAVRAMRGSGAVLLMHINMWLAGFDSPNATTYYNNVNTLATDIINGNGGAYQLLPLSQTKVIFKGRSKEGLFEIPQNVNYGESFGWSAFSDNVLYAPYKNYQITTSYLSYLPAFMQKLFPQGSSDQRISAWYDPATMYSGGNKFLMLKFANVYANQNAEDVNPDDNQTVFRLPDIYLLQAEALNKLGKTADALAAVNVVRNRAGATPLAGLVGDELDKEIFFERCREFMGEGLYWYDVVRTKRIIDPSYEFGYHCSVSQFAAGAWTWPLDGTNDDNAVTKGNPLITVNTYWQ
ncbi:RagB/SusD family nutrient uptake outer membrane protein [Niabella pedocola]|uniref:RagB/SusD family nutrient uptake outer membrane protein n=1 Tax=Niabella pedocola TaxID=1752077 RepID=A0ABS8PUS2_9BACT|nr:RagB/SusD family nutrient uptake outer membrane protein [Niabella pedocola]MCD2424660.1 RagB/SusD family nutrient uptake outer membrane protein [Niabella pedocola]